MPMKDNVPTWLEPWHEFNVDLLSAEMRQLVLAEQERWRAEREQKRQEQAALLNRLVASVDVIASTAIPELKFYTLDDAVDITARAITAALHDVHASEAHTSEYWADTRARHQERLRALIELGRLNVFDTNTGSMSPIESRLPDWAECANRGLTRSGMVDFARCQGVEIIDSVELARNSTKKQNTMLKVIAALLYLRNQPQSDIAISKQIERWAESIDGELHVTSRTVTSYIKEIRKTLGLSRKELGLPEREEE